LAGNGKKEWAYSGKEFTGAQWISQTSDDGFIVAGNAIDGQQGLDLQLVKLDKSGRKMWSKTYGKSMTWEYASCVQQTSDGGYVVSGQTESFGAGRYDGWILKTDENGNYTGSTGIPDQSKLIEFSLFQNYPNPFTKSTIIPFQLSKPGNILLKILNLSGMVVETSIVGYYPAGEFKVVYEPKSLLTGIYVYRLEVNDLSLSRIMIMK
jgi:hypothetical protein